ncbi:hypothetical protein R3P38DRAFT_2502490 [Favolaschia claudopus]|uniref:DUF7587 domain-containing protein n=1 Tax=Favolaschia claudopus TaxID=2862362 RepID=A0AAW0DKE2_9AGAR
MIQSPRPPAGSLPQYGFGEEVEFKKLVSNNAFLFRVHSPKSPSHSESLFPALRFDGRYSNFSSSSKDSNAHPATYADVVRYMDWTTRHSSPYISASFSFMWAVWEAARRYHFGVKHDVEIAVIDATALPAHLTVTAMEVLNGCDSAKRDKDHRKWSHFAQESQLVLIYGGIPHTAVLTSIPLLQIVDKLPSYCFHNPLSLPAVPAPVTPLSPLSPSFLLSKPSFHNFCISQSASYLCANPATRFLDSTTAAVRLALAFLGVWFQWMVTLHPPPSTPKSIISDFPGEDDENVFVDAAVTKVTELARAIALWPAAGETNRMWDMVVREIALLVAEEVKRVVAAAEKEPFSRCQSPDLDLELPLKGKGKATTSHTVVEEEEEGYFSSSAVEKEVPIFLDPRNFLPTPPPTPPPSLMVSRAGSGSSSSGLKLPNLTAQEDEEVIALKLDDALNELDSTLEEDVASIDAHKHSTYKPSSSFSATLFPSLNQPSSSAPASSTTLHPDDPESEYSGEPTSSPVRRQLGTLVKQQLSSLGGGETASCLVTGFSLGALLVVVLSQRRQTAMLYCT